MNLVDIQAGGREFRIEFDWVGDADPDAPVIVFLHEGLGSRSMWKDFPQRLCEAAGIRGLVYSRPGYGQSTPRAPDEHWGPDFMHIQARQVLPALLNALGVTRPAHLFGHSDGGSIALIHAASFPGRVASATVMAPHLMVEEFGLVSIREARVAYETTDLRSKLGRHHADVDSASRTGRYRSTAFHCRSVNTRSGRRAACRAMSPRSSIPPPSNSFTGATRPPSAYPPARLYAAASDP